MSRVKDFLETVLIVFDVLYMMLGLLVVMALSDAGYIWFARIALGGWFISLLAWAWLSGQSYDY